jgi:DUF4097 and DUF4098 domain-containing protein YvlB
MKRMWIGTGIVAAVAALSSCDGFEGFDRAKEDFHYSYPLQPGGRLEIENTNGSIDITGWDRNTLDVSGTKYAASNDRLRDIQIKVEATGNNASIRTETPKEVFHGGFGARYVIRVPRQITLARAHTTNGSFSIEDLEGGGHVTSTNGRISLARDTGDYDVKTTNGAIDLEECSGIEEAATTNGAVRGRIRAGAIEAESTNGGIDFTVVKPQDDKPVRLSTTNGAITLAMAEFHGNPITAETTHGGVTLRLPSDTNAQLRARNSFASISTDFPLSSTEEISKHQLKGRLGNGGPLISASSNSGSIRIEKY